jgi:transposase
MFVWTPAARVKLNKLRHEDKLSLTKCASIIGCSESAVYKALYPKPKPPPQPKPKPAPKKLLLPPHELNRRCIQRRRVDPEAIRNTPQLTKAQLYYDLARAVRNTLTL